MTSIASADQWTCVTPLLNASSPVGGPITITVDRDKGRVIASSPAIQFYNGGAVKAHILRETPRKLELEWDFAQAQTGSVRNGQDLRYWFVLHKSTDLFQVQAGSPSVPKPFETQGSCTKQ